MLVQKNPLPCPERKAPYSDRYRQIRCCQYRADVRRHIVRSLSIVLEARISVSNEAREKCLDITQHTGIGILANNQTGARMSTEHVTESGVEPGFGHDRRDLPGDLIDAATVCRDLYLFLEHGRFPLG